jgi:autotransporter translocation and assembly factor TamB
VIRLGARGAADDLELKLTSDPAMEQEDIITYLATGRPPVRSGEPIDKDSEALDAGTAMAVGQAAAAFEDIGTSLGVDVLQVQNDGARGVMVVAGNFVGTRTYLGLRQSATFESQSSSSTSAAATTEAEMDYRIREWLQVNLQGGAESAQILFRLAVAY